jgi:predicted nucleic acid-binding protein
VLRALTYPRVRKHIRGKIEPEPWFEDLIVLADMVAGERHLPGICQDPDDDKYVAAAVEGRVAFVATGDLRFLALKEHAGVRIVTPRTFLGLLSAS